MNNKHKITVALTTCLLVAPAVMAGSWFAGCTLRTYTKWDTNAAARNDIANPRVRCAVPGPYYDEGNTHVLSCTGRKYEAGFCDPEKFSWAGCDPSVLKGWGTKRYLKGECIQQYNPDGSVKMYYVDCKGIVVVGVTESIRAQCDGK
jgi:hypothetical protein